jgi:hypothetical protein
MPVRCFAAAAILVAVCAAPAAAQVTQASGRVMLSQADGSLSPVPNAVVEFHRTDIRAQWAIKTNARGEYFHAGLPYVGTFTIIVSAPGAAPAFAAGRRISQRPVCSFVLQPGDGRRPALEETRSGAVSPIDCEATERALPPLLPPTDLPPRRRN